jgi:FtsP/CotA-like multicopper oxidase with cupredoxin domain
MMMVGTGELLVNGQKVPVHTMTPGATERWRIINATADRYLRLGLTVTASRSSVPMAA